MKNNEKNTATILHLSALSQYLLPFGNYIVPTIIWSTKKDDSEFINQQGKNVLNFQLSIFLYSIILLLIGIPILIYRLLHNTNLDAFINGNHNFETLNHENLTGLMLAFALAIFLFVVLKITEFVLIIIGAVTASNGQIYKYPLSINFIK